MSVFEVVATAWEEIEKHALADYPDECCGLLVLTAEGAAVLHPCENIQNKLHAQDPEEHPRTAKTAYRMNDLQVARILKATEDEGGKLSAIYHSHIDCDAYFSEEDQAAAQFFGEPAYPGVTYLVVSVIDNEVKNRKAFSWNDQSGQFEDVPLTIV
jgi:[CysO sulfur-carrier protein]-S-L-cysteine hydrolase